MKLMTQHQNHDMKRQIALALGYNSEEQIAPKVIAKGKGYIAEKILELAKNKGVPIQRDDDLLALLYKLEIDEEIPPELYEAVARLLTFIYQLNQKS